MAKSRLLWSLIVVIGFWATAGTSFATTAKPKCAFTGPYSFFFWEPGTFIDGVGYFSVNCAGAVLPGGIINCNGLAGFESESFIEGGAVFLEKDGEGTMLIETEGSDGICDSGTNALELDISVVQGGKTVLFNSDGERYADSGLVPQAGYYGIITGRADKCFAGQIRGCYNIRLWGEGGLGGGPIDGDSFAFPAAGDCTICVNGAGGVTGGECRCNDDGFETLSEIETGGYTLGEDCESSTGYLWFTTSSDLICDETSSMALDFAVATGGDEIIGACDPGEFILDNESLDNSGFFIPCAFEGWHQ